MPVQWLDEAHNIDEKQTNHTIRIFWYGHRSFCHHYPSYTSFSLLLWLTFPVPDLSEKRIGRTRERKGRVPPRRWISSQHRSCGPWKETAMNLDKETQSPSRPVYHSAFCHLLRLAVLSYFYSSIPFSRLIFPRDSDWRFSDGLPTFLQFSKTLIVCYYYDSMTDFFRYITVKECLLSRSMPRTLHRIVHDVISKRRIVPINFTGEPKNNGKLSRTSSEYSMHLKKNYVCAASCSMRIM